MKTEIPLEQQMAKNSLLRTLAELRKGSVVTKASEDLARLVQEVQKLGKPGELKIVLKVRPNADGVTLAIEAGVDAKLPKPDQKATTFFPNEEGQLFRDDPSQKDLPFGVVNGGVPDEPAQSEPEQQTANA